MSLTSQDADHIWRQLESLAKRNPFRDVTGGEIRHMRPIQRGCHEEGRAKRMLALTLDMDSDHSVVQISRKGSGVNFLPFI